MQASQSAGPLMVWVDSTRVSAAQAFQRAHPNVKLNIVTYDGNANGADTLPTKVGLYDRTRSGWPDVVFSATDNETSWAVAAGFTAPPNQGLTPWATPEQLCQRLPGPCTVNGKVYCLRNDLPTVPAAVELPAPTRIALTLDMGCTRRSAGITRDERGLPAAGPARPPRSGARMSARRHSAAFTAAFTAGSRRRLFILARAVGRAMLDRGHGNIIFTASLLSFQCGINMPGRRSAASPP